MADVVRSLPWLQPPPHDTRKALQDTIACEGVVGLLRLAAAADYRWSEPELRTLGRKLDKARCLPGWSLREAAADGFVPFTLLILSSDTAKHLVDALCATALRARILLTCRIVEYEEPETWLAANKDALRTEPPDATVLLLNRKAFSLQSPVGDERAAEACIDKALARAEHIVAQIRSITNAPVILQTLAPDATDPQLSSDAWLPGSPKQLTMAFNRALIEFSRANSCVLFDTAAIAELVGHENWHAGRYWYVAKLPFAPDCIPFYCHRLVQLLAAMLGKSRRVLVLDLDETLWGGVVGRDGISGLVLGGRGSGEAFLAIQRMALQYRERGVLLCVASKNSLDSALEVFNGHPEMLLREADIAMFQVNWDDKASNIAAMAEELGLGLDTFVFIDDNPVERKQVRDTLPAVAVPELPEDPAKWLAVIQGAAYFEQTRFSAEDAARTEYYRGNSRRNREARSVGDPRKFLLSLKTIATISAFDSRDRTRVAQLIAKTNQFNLTSLRYAEEELAEMESCRNVETLQVRVRDLFGDSGLVSAVICRKDGAAWEIDSWIMSCRVLKRGIEQAVLNVLAARARSSGATALRGRYLPTKRNAVVRDHYAKLGFAKLADGPAGETRWSLPLMDFIPIDVPIEIREAVLSEQE